MVLRLQKLKNTAMTGLNREQSSNDSMQVTSQKGMKKSKVPFIRQHK
jgi:hypothetical protein